MNKYFDINKIDFNKNFQIIIEERGYGYYMEKLALKKKLNELVTKYVDLSNDSFKKEDLEKAKIYSDMKNDILSIVEICISRNKF